MNRRSLLALSMVAPVAATAGAWGLWNRLAPDGRDPDGDGLVRAGSPVLGKPDAPVTLVEFLDPACGSCRAFHVAARRVLLAHPGRLRLVLRYVAGHAASIGAVRILSAAHRQGRLALVLDELLGRQAEWAAEGYPEPARAWELAAGTGLDLARARADAVAPEVNAALRDDAADALRLGLGPRPAVFIDGRRSAIPNALSLHALVDAEIDRLRRAS